MVGNVKFAFDEDTLYKVKHIEKYVLKNRKITQVQINKNTTVIHNKSTMDDVTLHTFWYKKNDLDIMLSPLHCVFPQVLDKDYHISFSFDTPVGVINNG